MNSSVLFYKTKKLPVSNFIQMKRWFKTYIEKGKVIMLSFFYVFQILESFSVNFKIYMYKASFTLDINYSLFFLFFFYSIYVRVAYRSELSLHHPKKRTYLVFTNKNNLRFYLFPIFIQF